MTPTSRMKLAALAEVSSSLAATRSRTAKATLLADCLRALDPAERETGVAWLAGLLPGGHRSRARDGHGMRDVPPAVDATLTIADARARLDALRDIAGKGSTARRKRGARELVRGGHRSPSRVSSRAY